ncbi:MAG: FkbM family methyltransferase [Pelagibacterales bacterium]|nr:FkbM family methyltransferase [Pelagibacterales bacterium]
MKKIRGQYFYKHLNYLYKIYALYIKHNSFIPKSFYSIFGEDIFADKFFKKLDEGFYVDVGSYHPFFWSNTYLLFKRKWKGINVDINRLSVELFNIARPNDHNVNVSVSNTKKKTKKYYTKNMINTMSTTDLSSAKTSYLKGYDVRSIRCLKLNDIIEKSSFKNRKINFLNIDTEKTELDVLKSLNFKKYQPELICVEIHHRGSSSKNKFELTKHPVYLFLKKRSYKIVWKKEYSIIFSYLGKKFH